MCQSEPLEGPEKLPHHGLKRLASIYSVQKFRFYILGRFFTILVDHCALCALNNTRAQNNSRLRRCTLALSEYDFTVKYVKGTANCDVNCLSRAPVMGEHDLYMSSILSSMPQQAIAEPVRPAMIVRPINKSASEKSYSESDETFQAKAANEVEGFY